MRLLLLICYVGVLSVNVNGVVYHIPGKGDVRGVLVNKPSDIIDGDVYQFTGIPFGQPPVGDLRFSPPLPALPWEADVLDATKLSPSCMQPSKNLNVREDCLYLNIWTPKQKPKELFPVMVWFYGGGFNYGSISQKEYIGDVLAVTGNVVVVTVNYRLGAFGFGHIAEPGGEITMPGNIGFIDQQLGLQWVYENINAFHGDRSQITILGESAGAASVTAHLVAPGSSHLFIRAIAQSGTMASPWASRTSEFLTNKTIQLAVDVGCKNDYIDKPAILRCLRAADASAIVNATGIMVFKPVDNDPNFFQGSVFERLTKTNLSGKDLILGNTADEHRMYMSMLDFPSLKKKWKLDRNGYSGVANRLLSEYSENINFVPFLRDAIMWHYDNVTAFGESYLKRYAQLGTDFMFACSVRRVAAEWLSLQPSMLPNSIFLYTYNQSYFTPDGLGIAQLKAFHGSDISPTFGDALRRIPTTKGIIYENVTDTATFPDGQIFTHVSQLRDIAVKFTRFWTNFAKFGNPNGGSHDNMDNWIASTDPKSLLFRVLQADERYSRMIHDRSVEDCAFWKEVIYINSRLKT